MYLKRFRQNFLNRVYFCSGAQPYDFRNGKSVRFRRRNEVFRRIIKLHDTAALSPARWHSTNTYLPSLGMLGTEPDYFPTQQPLF